MMPASTCAERRANRDLAPPPGAAREQQIRDVRARHQHQHRRRAHQRARDRALLAADRVLLYWLATPMRAGRDPRAGRRARASSALAPSIVTSGTSRPPRHAARRGAGRAERRRHRDPDLARAGKPELRRHHADDGVRRGIETDDAPDDLFAAIPPVPERIADQRDPRGGDLVVASPKPWPRCGCCRAAETDWR